jgi:hypothetical protein
MHHAIKLYDNSKTCYVALEGNIYCAIDIFLEREDDPELFSWMLDNRIFEDYPKCYQKLAQAGFLKCLRYFHKKLIKENSFNPHEYKDLWVCTESSEMFSLFLNDNIIDSEYIMSYLLSTNDDSLMKFIADQYVNGKFILSTQQISLIKKRNDLRQLFQFS